MIAAARSFLLDHISSVFTSHFIGAKLSCIKKIMTKLLSLLVFIIWKALSGGRPDRPYQRLADGNLNVLN